MSARDHTVLALVIAAALLLTPIGRAWPRAPHVAAHAAGHRPSSGVGPAVARPDTQTNVTDQAGLPRPGAPTRGDNTPDHWAQALTQKAAMGAPVGGTWQQVGATGLQAGAVDALAVDPRDPHIVYAGASSGGVWKSTDAGQTWRPTTDAQPSLVVTSLAIAPTAPYTLYALTGHNLPIGGYNGAGMMASADGGASWQIIGGQLAGQVGYRLIVDPTLPTTLYAATGSGPVSGGVFRSSDGGMTWQCVLGKGCAGDNGTLPGRAWDVTAVAAGNGTTLYAALDGKGIFRSTDRGQNWTRLDGLDAVAPPSSVGNVVLATTPVKPHALYAAIEDTGAIDNQGGTLLGVYESQDDGATWHSLAHPPDGDVGGATPAHQYWYDLYIAADPVVSGTLYLGGLSVFKSADDGATWNDVSTHNPGDAVHSDQRAIALAPNAVYIGNDGGVYVSADNGTTWHDISAGLDALQMYGLAVASSHSTPSLMYAGTQDNGVRVFDGAHPWPAVIGGDGAHVAIDPATPSSAYVGGTGGGICHTTDGGQTCTAVPTPPGSDPHSWITPFAIDPTKPQRLLYGTNRVWETTDSAQTWHPLGNGQPLSPRGTLNEVTIAPGVTSTIYAGSTDGIVAISVDDGGTWYTGSGLPGRSITSIAVSAASSQIAWAGLSGYDGDTSLPGHIYHTTDGGHTWSNSSGNLPDAPVQGIALDGASGAVYAATSVGVFRSPDGGQTWALLGQGLPLAPVTTVVLRDDGTVFAATFGRGAWMMHAPPVPPTPTATAVPPTATATAAITVTPTTTPTATGTATATATVAATARPICGGLAGTTATATVAPPTPTATIGPAGVTTTTVPMGAAGTPTATASTTSTVTASTSSIPAPACAATATATTAAGHGATATATAPAAPTQSMTSVTGMQMGHAVRVVLLVLLMRV